MSQIRQVSLLPAGCQPWNIDVCAASGDRFAYCATLAVYIYQLDVKYNEFKLHSIMSEHKKTVTAICWHPKDSDQMATASADKQVIIWSIPDQTVLARLDKLREIPICIGWNMQDHHVLSFMTGRGPLLLWNYQATGGGLTFHKDAQSFSSSVCQLRWHHKHTGKLVLGHVDGSISLFVPGKKTQKHIMRPSDEDDGSDNEEDPVLGLEWDPLSTEYLLIARTHSSIVLVDADSVSVLQRFQLPSVAARVHALAWISNAPGMFVTGDTHSGVLRIWSVAKSSPLENLKLKKSGFHALHVFTNAPGKSDESGENTRGYMMPTLSPAGRYALPPAYAVCAFMDGGVGLYDLGKRRWYFLRNEGHIETIFDCKFKPESSEFLATASFDGTIKIWDVNTLTTVNTSPGNEGVIYCLSWAPADLDCVVASTSKNGAFVWDLTKNKVIKRYKEHSEGAVYSVAWNQKDSRRIATCGGDGYCIVRHVDGQLLAKFKHPAAAFGCDWNPNNKDLIATGCEDCKVRVFYLPTANNNQNPSGQPLKTFSGHTAKVFNVRWSPLRDGMLCSGSDDGTVRVWDYTKDSCTMVLKGHTAPVRGLLWNSEIPYLLISGSWDYSMRVWDVRDGACLDTVYDHGADVYGITSHPDRPFVFASSSRDSTVRVWSLTPLLQSLELNFLASKPWDDFLASPEQSISLGSPPLLCGKASKDLRTEVERGKHPRAKALQSFSRLFSSPNGSSNLWELVNVVQGMDGSGLSLSYEKGVMHIKHLLKFKTAKAQELGMMRSSKYGGIRSKSRDERLREAAELYLKVGNLQRYCDTLTELDDWDKALAVAPGVSMQYWQSLCEKRVSLLKQDESELVVPYAVAMGDVESLVHHFTNLGQLQEAMMAATAGHEGTITAPHVLDGQSNGVQAAEEGDCMQLLMRTTCSRAEWYLRNGGAIMAACCHLAVDDCKGAIAKLIRGNELELAFSAATVLNNTPELLHLATIYLSRRCERIGKWELGVELLRNLPNNELHLARLCARCAASMDEINGLHRHAGFPSMEECLAKAERGGGDVLRTVMFYILSTQPEKGLEIGMQYVKDRLKENKWLVSDVWDILQMMSSVQTEKLQHHKCGPFRGEVLIMCSYVGALVAIRRRYDSIVVPLFRHTLWLMKKEAESRLPLSESLISSELDAFIAYKDFQANSKSRRASKRASNMNVEQQGIIETLFKRAGEESYPIEEGEDVVSSSNLPCHSDVHRSFFTNKRIHGPSFFLEDGRSAIAISEALMWAKVMPFSPLGSGVRINPF